MNKVQELLWDIGDRIFLVALFSQYLLHHALDGTRNLYNTDRRGPMSSAVWTAYKRRQRQLLLKGLRPFRYRWPGIFATEYRPKIWRYVSLLEKFQLDYALQHPKPAPQIPERILIENLGHIGDVLQTLPSVRALRIQYPEAHITYLCGPWNKALLSRVDSFDECVTYSPDLVMSHRGQTADLLSPSEEIQLLRDLRDRDFDLMITTTNSNFVEYFLRQAIAPKKWVGVEWNFDLYPSSEKDVGAPYKSGGYEASRLAKVLAELGVSLPEPPSLEFPLEEKEIQWAQTCLVEHGITENEFVVLAPGAGWDGKCWPIERFATLSELILNELSIPIVLVGGPSETGLGQSFSNSARIINLIGKTSLFEMAALLSKCAAFICNDSGPMHIAAAFEVPILSLFGPTRPEQWGPQYEKAKSIRKVEGCQGCWHWHPSASCSKEGYCMKQIEVQEVFDTLQHMLESA